MSHQNGMLFGGGAAAPAPALPRAAVLALPGDDAHADQEDRQPLRRLPVQRRPLRVERMRHADQHVADHHADAELPDRLEARPVDDLAGEDERQRRQPDGPAASGTAGPPPGPACGTRPATAARPRTSARVAEVTRLTSDFQLGNGSRNSRPSRNARIRLTHGTPALVDPGEDLREVAVPGQAVADPRGRGLVDQAGAERGDERVDPQDDRQPAEPGRARESGERPDWDRVVRRYAGPAVREPAIRACGIAPMNTTCSRM